VLDKSELMLRKLLFRNTTRHRPVRSSPDLQPPALPGVLVVKSTDELLLPHRGLIVQIDELAGLSKTHFERFYYSTIVAFARFVQQLPASEVHHHAGPGGMLAHGLEVAANALKLRRSYLLSESGDAEEISVKQDLWTYAVFTGALAHDLAKVAVDQRITAYDHQHQETVWQPWSQFIDEQGLWYTTEFVRHRQYHLHEKASPLLVHRIIPDDGMKWLASDPYILAQWLAAVSGDTDHPSSVREIVSLADQQSVASNLGADNTRLPGVKTKPLHEKIVTALRFLLSEGALPLNRNGAAGWVLDDYCWLVSKRTVDAIREQLTTEGHSGIPTKNGRMFDVMQEHGILVPWGDRAIWSATVQGEDFSHDLTLIKIPVSTVWPNAGQRPEQFDGKIITQQAAVEPEPATRTPPATQAEQAPRQTAPERVEIQNSPDTASEPTEVTVSATSLNTGVTESLAAVDENDILQFLPSESSVASAATESSLDSESEAVSDNLPDKTTVGINCQGRSPGDQAKPDAGGDKLAQKLETKESASASVVQAVGGSSNYSSGDVAGQFFGWLQQAVADKQLSVNKAKARVHVVNEGVIIVTPGIFQDFAKSQANSGQLSWNSVQQKVLKKNWHVRDAKGLNVIKYNVKGQNRQTVINAVLFEDKTRVFGGMTPPDANYHLQRE